MVVALHNQTRQVRISLVTGSQTLPSERGQKSEGKSLVNTTGINGISLIDSCEATNTYKFIKREEATCMSTLQEKFAPT